MACRSATQDSTSCSPALLMLGREIRTPAEMMVGRPPDDLGVPPGPDYARKLQDRLESAHEFARDKLQCAGAKQKRNYDVHARGRNFEAGELVWVYSPQRKKGRCPKLDSVWVGPCRVLERLGEVVYRVQLPPRGRKVALHRDRLAPYRGTANPTGAHGTLDTAQSQTPPHAPPGDLNSPSDPSQNVLLPPFPVTLSAPPSSPSSSAPGCSRPRRNPRSPERLCLPPWGRGT